MEYYAARAFERAEEARDEWFRMRKQLQHVFVYGLSTIAVAVMIGVLTTWPTSAVALPMLLADIGLFVQASRRERHAHRAHLAAFRDYVFTARIASR